MGRGSRDRNRALSSLSPVLIEGLESVFFCLCSLCFRQAPPSKSPLVGRSTPRQLKRPDNPQHKLGGPAHSPAGRTVTYMRLRKGKYRLDAS